MTLIQTKNAPVNVFKDLREESGLSHAELSRKMHISKQALIRLEQGMFTEPLPTVLEYYVKYHGVSELRMRDAYEGFQHAVRRSNFRYFGIDLNGDPSYSDLDNLHPFRQLRKRVGVNPTEVAKALCLPQPTIVHFEQRYRTQQTVPKTLEYVLYEIGYTAAEIRIFKTNYDAFRKGRWGRG